MPTVFFSRMQTSHTEHPLTQVSRKEMWSTFQLTSTGFISIFQAAAEGRAKVRQSFDSPWNQIYCLVHNGKAMTIVAIKLVLLETKHNETRDALVTHITKIVFTGLINLHLYFCEWQVFIPHMEGTLGEAVFQYLLKILWKDIQSVNFQIKIEPYIEK